MNIPELTALYEKATKGEWRWTAYGLLYGGPNLKEGDGPSKGTEIASIHGWRDMREGDHEDRAEVNEEAVRNGTLICELHNSFPALREEILRLRKIEEAARKALEEIHSLVESDAYRARITGLIDATLSAIRNTPKGEEGKSGL